MRKVLFNAVDFLKGNQIKRNYGEVKSIMNDSLGNEASMTRKGLTDKLLRHVSSTVPYYENYSSLDLVDFPVISKTKIQDDFEAFRSSQYLGDNLFRVSTSGSTGVPFVLFHNKAKRRRNTADVLYFLHKTGYEVGNRLVELEVWRNHNMRSGIKNFIQNSIQFDISKPSEEQIERLLHLLANSKQRTNILGFSSALETICQYLDDKENNFEFNNINGVIANSEYLNDYTRNKVKEHFNAPIYSRYSNEELGILAHQTSTSGSAFEINWASYIVEILDFERDVPVQAGEKGRLVVTDLFNYSMPLVRYDTGDIAMFESSDQRFLKTVEGRKMDMVYDTKGQMLSSYVVYTKFYPFYDLLNQYQFIQTNQKTYVIKLNAKDGFPYESDLINSVKDDFGQDANVKVEYVDEIPPLSSGKRKKVVNLWQN